MKIKIPLLQALAFISISFFGNDSHANIGSKVETALLEAVDEAARAGVNAWKKYSPTNILGGQETGTSDQGLLDGADLPPGHDLLACRDIFPNKRVIDVDKLQPWMKAIGLCNKGFATIYSPVTRTPLLTIERLNRENLLKAQKQQRYKRFYSDPRLDFKQQLRTEEMNGSGWSRGHMAPSANMPDEVSRRHSNVLTNIVLQNSEQNSGPWEKIESDVRKYTIRAQGDVFVYTGPIFRSKVTYPKTGQYIPTELFKLVYDSTTGKSWAYILPNRAGVSVRPPVDYATFKKETGWGILDFLPSPNN